MSKILPYIEVGLSESQAAETLIAELWYPRTRPMKFVEVGLCDIRAADNIRVSYDFERDGWKIEQASNFSRSAEDQERDEDWAEVAFIKAWARETS
mgnify:CR=1 FL=1